MREKTFETLQRINRNMDRFQNNYGSSVMLQGVYHCLVGAVVSITKWVDRETRVEPLLEEARNVMNDVFLLHKVASPSAFFLAEILEVYIDELRSRAFVLMGMQKR